jgi:hypothetical protein
MGRVVNGKRTRGRSGRNKPSNPRNQTFDSTGPEGKVRGSASQVFEKYLALARDAQSSGDRISAENFFQHAEHYYRILSVSAQGERNRPQANGVAHGGAGGRGNGRAASEAEDPASAPQPVIEAAEPESDVVASPKTGSGRSRKTSSRSSATDESSAETADT